MRELTINQNPNTRIIVHGKPGQGGANHEYTIEANSENKNEHKGFALIHFQNGPIKENGINGCQQEDLLAIVIDRLRSFQDGKFSCRSNALALTKCEEALMWLQSRTKERQQRGVEGLNVK